MKRKINKLITVACTTAILASISFENIVNAEINEPNMLNSGMQMVDAAETEEPVAVNTTENVDDMDVEAVEVETEAVILAEDFNISAVEEDVREVGDDAVLQVKAFNRGKEAAVLKIFFWDHSEELPENKEEWGRLLTTACSHITVNDTWVIYSNIDGNMAQGMAQLEQESQNGVTIANHLSIPVPAGYTADFDVSVKNTFAETITAVPVMADSKEEVYGEAISFTWSHEDVSTESGDSDADLPDEEDIPIETESTDSTEGEVETNIPATEENSDIIIIETENVPETESESLSEDSIVEEETSSENVTETESGSEFESEMVEVSQPEVPAETEQETEDVMQESEHFLEKAEGVEELDPKDFVSKRLLVLAEENVIIDPEHIIGTYDRIYLLEYTTIEQSMNAYLYYQEHAHAVEPDTVMNSASELIPDDTDEVVPIEEESESLDYLADKTEDIITRNENPFSLLAEVDDSAATQNLIKSEECVIALIDTGAQPVENIIDSVSFADDKLYGGTHGDEMVAAIVSQNQDAKILSIRALNDSGYGTVSSIVAAMEYAISQKVDIINLSMSARKTLSSAVLESVIQRAFDEGIIVVGAAGNNGEDAANYMPGAVEAVYVMGACTEEGVRQNSSNFGESVNGYVEAKSTSEATALMSGFISLNGENDIEKFQLFHKEVSEPENIEIEEPDVSKEESDDAIFDAVIENYVKDNADPAFTTVDKIELSGVLPVKNTLVDAEKTDYDMTIDRLMSTDFTTDLMESFITQVNTFVAVYDLSDNSDYYVAYADTMHADKSTEVIDSEMAYFNTAGEDFSDYHYDKYTGLVYIPKYHYVLDDKKYDDAVQIQLLQRTFLDGSFSVNSHVTAVVDDTEAVEVSSNSENAFVYATNIKVQKDLDLDTLVVSVNGIAIPKDMYAYDPVSGNLGIGLSTAAIQNISVFCDGRDFDQEMAAAGVSYAQMTACNKQGKLADIDFKALSINKTYEGTIEAKRDAKVSDSDSDNMYRVDGSYSDGEYQKTLADIIKYLAGLTQNASGIHGNTSSGNLVHTDDGSWVMAISSIKIPGQPIKFEQLVYDNKHVRLDTTCAHIANKDYAYGGLTAAERKELKKRYPDYFSDEAGDEGADIVQNNRGKWFRIPVLLRPLYIYKSSNPAKEDSYVVMAMCTQRTATQNGAGIFKVKVKDKEAQPPETETEPPLPPTEPGSLHVVKNSMADKEILDLKPYSLEGAEFSVTSGGFTAILKTDKNGITNRVELPDNSVKEWIPPVYDKDGNKIKDGYWHTTSKTTTYTITETRPPMGHKVNSTPQKLTVTMPRDAGKEFKITFEDEPIFCENEFEIEKLDTKGNPIEGVMFEVKYYDAESANDKKQLKRTWYLESDASGKVRFDDAHVSTRFDKYKSDKFYTHKGRIVIPIDGYLQIKEVEVPASYVLDGTAWGMPTGETAKLTKRVYNDYEPGSVHLRKYGSDKATPLPGVEFELKFVEEKTDLTEKKSPNFKRLLEPGETIVKSTDSKGEVVFTNLDHGTYEITEIKTLPGQALLKDKIIFEIPIVMTEDEVKEQGNVDYDKGKYDSYTNSWFFFDPIYEVTNTINFMLPMTGGIGVWKYGLVGMGILFILGVGLIGYEYVKRKHK